MAPALVLHLDFRDSVSVIQLSGRLAAGDLPRLAEAVRQAEARKPKGIHLDLGGLDYIDSAGLGFLTAQHKHFLDSGIEFRLLHAQPAVMRIFHLTNLDKVLLLDEVEQDPLRQILWQRETLWESFNYSQFILMALGEGLLGLDLEGRILFANPTAERLFGWSEAQLHKRLLGELIAAPSNQADWQGDALYAQPRRQVWVSLRHADGASFEAVIVTVIVQRKSERVGMLVGINDRTELEHTRTALRSTQRQLALIAASTSDGLIMYDLTDQPTFVNKAARAITGYPLELLQKMRWSELATPSETEQWESIWHQAQSGRSIQNRSLRLRTHEGADRWCLVSVVPVMDEQGQRMGQLFTLRDVDEGRRLTDRLQFLERMESVTRLAGGLAGDLSQIVGREREQLAQLTAQLTAQHPARSLAAEISQQHEYLRSIIEQLLASTRHYAGPAEAVLLSDVAKAVLAGLRSRLAQRIEVNYAWAEDALLVLANRDELYQIVFHICLNSLEAMSPGGRLNFKSERVEIPEEERGPLKLRPAGSFIRLSIADNGRGMSPEIRERAFEPFFTTKKGGVGQGLGLALVYGLVRQNGGWVDLKSQPEVGTTVEIYLPIPAQAAVVAEGSATFPEGRSKGGECLLVIDDEPLVLNFATAYLQHLGYRTLRAENAYTALELYRRHHEEVDLVLMDLSLPDMAGGDLLAKLRAIRSDLRAIVSSGLDMETLAALSRQPGVRGTLQKPYRGEALGSAIRESLDME